MREILGKVVEEDGTGNAKRASRDSSSAEKRGRREGRARDGPVLRDEADRFLHRLPPAERSELLILVVIDEPQGQVYGGVVAAPAFNQIAVKTAYYLGIQPTEPALAAARPSGPSAPGRATPVSTARTAGAMVMPDLSGLSMGRVVDIMGRVLGQSLAHRKRSRPGADAGTRSRPRPRDGVLRDVHGGAAAEDRRRQGAR